MKLTGHKTPIDRAVTDTTEACSFVQAQDLGIGDRPLLARNRVVATGRCHAGLIPPLPLSRPICESVEDRSDLIVAVANRHPANDLQRLHWRCAPVRRARPIHFDLCMGASLPVDRESQRILFRVRMDDDLLDHRAKDLLLEFRRRSTAVPDLSKSLAHRKNSFLFL
jgi:hypothetical protein